MEESRARRCELDAGRGADAARLCVGALGARERGEVFAWLGAGLRGVGAEAFAAENPVVLGAPATVHALVRVGQRPASHALARTIRLRAAGRALPIGVVGSVYTDPAFRQQGLARRCVRALVDRLTAGGALAVALWTDLDALYAPLGFVRAGTEWHYEVDAGICRRAHGGRGDALEVAPPRAADWAALEALYAAKPVRADRPAGALALLASAPGATTLVARRGGAAVAYAAIGRGADLQGVVHEWAGDADGVAACVARACAEAGALRLLASDCDEPLVARLREAGAERARGDVALVAVPDPVRLWRAITCDSTGLANVGFERAGERLRLRGEAGAVDLDGPQAIALLLGPARPERCAEALSARQYLALRTVCPWPFHVWGFDSL